jgi:hypothetical protein
MLAPAVVPAAMLAAALMPALAAAAVLAATILLDVAGNGPIGLARLGDPGKHGDGAAKRETGNDDSNQLGHGVLHSYGQTVEGGRHVSPDRATFA